MKRSNLVICSAAALCAIILIAASMPGQTGGVAHKFAGFLFHTADRCIACHNGLTTSSGEDVSIGYDWRPTLMANAARDPYFHAGVRRETLDHPESAEAISQECAPCHMPMASFAAKTAGSQGSVFAHLPFDADKEDDRLAADGVSCSLCHQITRDKFGTRESFNGGYVVDTRKPLGERNEYGPYAIAAGQSRIMRSSTGGFQPAESPHMREAALCATCHTLYTHTLGPGGKELGEFPEQMPYQEWLHSAYRNERSCQACHMPAVSEPIPITSLYGEPRPGVSRHAFIGSNFLMPKLLNRYRSELGVDALVQELDAASARTASYLATEAAEVSVGGIEQKGDRIEFAVSVNNLGGHKLPTAYPSRRAWLHVTVRDRNGAAVFESGAFDPSGMIKGNDNDADPHRFEPHYQAINSSDQVQIYEAIMVESSGTVTTGLLSAVRYIKDNRLLPRGFDKKTANLDVAVQGDALQDADFDGNGDRVRYSVAVGNGAGPFQVEAELWYQPIAYRWAQNLRSYKADEPARFVKYFEPMSQASAVRLATARTAPSQPAK